MLREVAGMSEQQAMGYTFGPAEPRGVILGQTSGQLLLLVADAMLIIQLLNPASSWPARFVMFSALLFSVACSYVPVRGETTLGWSRRWLLYRLQTATGQDEYIGGPFRMSKAEIEVPAARLPGLLGSTRFLQLSTGPGSPPVVVAHDQREGTYTVVLQLRGDSLHVIEADDQRVRFDAYGRMLAMTTRPNSPIKRLQIFERTVPDTSDVLQRDMNTRAAAAVALSQAVGYDGLAEVDLSAPPPATVSEQDTQRGVLFTTATYAQTIEMAGPAGRRHEVFAALAIDGSTAARDIAKSGGGDIGAAAVAAREVNTLAANLRSCGVAVLGWTPPRQLGYLLRTAYDPAAVDVIDRRGGGSNDFAGGDQGLPSGVDLRQAGPGRAANLWDCYRTDSAYHRTFWVAEWPRAEAPAVFLEPLLSYAEGRRAISLVYEPRDGRGAASTLRRKKSKADSESWLRNKFRLNRSKRAEQAASHLDRREDELLAGEALLALRAYVTISASSREELDLVESEVMQAAQQSRIELQPMTGAHDQGFSVGAVPLARSL